jgi:hypothetical protein
MLILNKEVINVLLQNVNASTSDLDNVEKVSEVTKQTSEMLLKHVTKFFPQLLEPQSDKLCEIILGNDLDIISDCLEALAQLVVTSPEKFSNDPKVIRRLCSFVKEGSEKQSKYSALILSYCPEKGIIKKLIKVFLTFEFRNL